MRGRQNGVLFTRSASIVKERREETMRKWELYQESDVRKKKKKEEKKAKRSQTLQVDTLKLEEKDFKSEKQKLP